MDLDRGLPGETPLADYSGLKQRRIKTVSDRARAELENNLKAFQKYLSRIPTRRMAPFTAAWMLRVHREMYGDVWAWAGKPRTTSGLNIGVPAYQILPDMEALARDIQYWRSGPWDDRIEQAATIHYRAVLVHPFLDGNGRWSRLLANIWLKQNRAPLIDWPESGMSETQSRPRAEYIAALITADKGDLSPLIELHKRYARATSD